MVKVRGSTPDLPCELPSLSNVEAGGISDVAVECVDIRRTPVAKAACWAFADTEARQRGEQTGLDTLVVHAVNDGY